MFKLELRSSFVKLFFDQQAALTQIADAGLNVIALLSLTADVWVGCP